jgi:hypothetical protein
MKYSELVPAKKLTVRKRTAVAMLEHEGLFERFIRHGWLRPCDRGQQSELYAVSDLEAAVNRLKREQLPE